MTRQFKTQFSNGLIASIKITVRTGRGYRIEGRRQVSTRLREPFSEMACRFQGQECMPEEVEAVQKEFNQWIAECAKDVSRDAGGLVTFQPVKVPVYEVRKYTPPADSETKKPATESDLDKSVSGSTEEEDRRRADRSETSLDQREAAAPTVSEPIDGRRQA